MITKYVIRNSNDSQTIEVDNLDEVQNTIMLLKEQNPHIEYSVDEKQVSSVKPGFGRDPDLH